MRERIGLFYLAVSALIFINGCGNVPAASFAEASPTATAVRNVLSTRQALPPSPVPATVPALPALTETMTPLPAPEEEVPNSVGAAATPAAADSFCCLIFASGPYGQATNTFPAGTEIVYAIWEYQGIRPGDRIRRLWLRDGLIWLPRDEKWDWDKYGESGTVRDLSIFDFEGEGLQPATYRLQLYLNDELLQEESFVILPP